MAWNESYVTTAGVKLLNETLVGRTLSITSAYGGTGTVDEQNLISLTDLSNRVQTLSLVGLEDVEGGKKVTVRISNKGLIEGYWLQQLGVFAHLDGEDKDTLLFIMQDPRGIYVPAEDSTPEFIIEMYAVIAINNNANIEIVVESNALVSIGQLNDALNDAFNKHNSSKTAHEDIRQEIAEIKEIAGSNGGAIIIPNLTIPASGWTETSEGDEYTYYIDVAVSEAQESQFPEIALNKESLIIARNAGMCPTVEALNGVLRLWAEKIPESDMSGCLVLLARGSGAGSGGTGSDSYVLPVATKDTLGGIKVGTGLQITGDGKLSPAADNISTENVATDNEVTEMLDEVYP